MTLTKKSHQHYDVWTPDKNFRKSGMSPELLEHLKENPEHVDLLTRFYRRKTAKLLRQKK